jgi:Mg2+-importing ATPase
MLKLLKSKIDSIFSFFISTKKTLDFNEINKEICAELTQVAELPTKELVKELGKDVDGLNEHIAKKRLKKFGYNKIVHEEAPAWYILLAKNFIDPFALLLLALSIISYFLNDVDATYIILAMVAISISMRFVQEYRSSKAAEKLSHIVSVKADITRVWTPHGKPEIKEIPVKLLVPGDIVHLSAGDLVPGDLRILSSNDLSVSQSVLTGESMPVEKSPNLNTEKKESITDYSNLCFLGTHVVNGTATGVVIKTGKNTYFGSMTTSMMGYRAQTSFDVGVKQITWLFIKFMVVLVPLVFIINILTKGNYFEALLFSLSVAVGLTPAMLPMIVTANLAKGAVALSKKKVIVKQLSAIQSFGAMNVLCTDKTGTLTQNQIILDKYLDLEEQQSDEVQKLAYLNSYFQTSMKNLMDQAILKHEDLEKEYHFATIYEFIDEIPFDFERRRMSVIIKQKSEQPLLICKGAVEEVLSICTKYHADGKIVKITEKVREKAAAIRDRLNKDGLRVLAVAYKNLTKNNQSFDKSDEHGLIFAGFLAFLDPPKHSVKQTIADLQSKGVQVKVLTGDSPLVAESVCRWAGIKSEKIYTGSDIDKMNDHELKQAVSANSIFAKINPLQKSKIIKALKEQENIVGYLGDGINDAAALREADIGISVNNAVDVAKESAHIILLEKSLHVLDDGIIEGRKIFANILKYLNMACSSNFGNVFSIIGASALLPFLPMKPLQILTQNFLYDVSQIAIPLDNVDSSYLKKPHRWSPNNIARFMLWMGPVSSLFDYVTFAVLWFVFFANTVENQALFQTGWFVEGLLSQTLIVHMIRTEKIPFIQSWPSLPLLFTTLGVMAIGVYLPYSFAGKALGMTPLPLTYFYYLFPILLGYCLLTQIVKYFYIRRYKEWL